jgi:hypothetical protein
MPDITTTLARSVIPIDLGSGRKGGVSVRADQIKYFGITVPAGAAEEQVKRTRDAHSRSKRAPVGEVSPGVIAVQRSEWNTPIRAARQGTGKKVVVPTEQKTTKGSIRKTTFHFPSNATVGAISNWLFEQLKTHKPKSFEYNGGTYAVLRITGDVNPGNTDEVG